MRVSKTFSDNQHFFTKRKILSENAALFFILEETVLLLLIVIQLYHILGVSMLRGTIEFFSAPILPQNILWLVGSILFFLIGYVVIAKRDVTIILIHANLAHIVLEAAQSKIVGLNRQVTVLIIMELVFAFILAVSIFLYLDPEVNVLPFPWNIVAFVFFLVVSLFLFSHTKQFRSSHYGGTWFSRSRHGGNEETVRFTNTRTGSVRIAPRRKYVKRSG